MVVSVSAVEAQPSEPEVASVEDVLPDGFTPGPEAVELLGDLIVDAAEINDVDANELTHILSHDSLSWLDGNGRLGYTMPDGMFDVPAGPAMAGGPTTAAALARGPFPYANTFLLHSKPGSSRTIYLDFDGHTLTTGVWNDDFGFSGPIVLEPFSIDSNLSAFSNAEQDAIQIAWQRVAEDFIPFDVDVTTEAPTLAQLERANPSDTVYGQRAVYTNDLDLFNNANACGGCSGVSYVSVFSDVGEYYEPSLAFTAGAGSNPKSMAEVLSHELGHSLGLNHDGRSVPLQEYYGGQGSWAPIMGDSDNRPISQWSIGDYANPSNVENDVTVFAANGAVTRADDHGNTLALATPLTSVSLAVNASGIISSRTDVDVFRVTAQTGPVTFTATPAATGPNLDIRLELLDSTGAVLAANDPVSGTVTFDVASGLGASVSLSVAGGTYYLRVDGVGAGSPLTTGYSDFASLGQYTLTGTTALDTIPPLAPTIATAVSTLSNDATPLISGTGETGATVTVTAPPSITLCQSVVVAGAWSCSSTVARPEGSSTIQATQADVALNVSPATAATLNLDLTAPSAPTIGSVGKTAAPTLGGTGEVGAIVDVVIDGNVACQTAAISGAGSWTCTAATQSFGDHQLAARQRDAAGNVSQLSPPIPLTIFDHYRPLASPARVLDTRDTATADGNFRNLGKVAPGSTLELPIADRVGIPSKAKLVELNLTVDGAESSGYLTVYPCGAGLPASSSINFIAGETVANAVFAKVGTGGKVCIFSSAAAHVVVDVSGFANDIDSLSFLAAPVRLADTRGPATATVDTRFAGGGTRLGGSVYEIDVAGRAGIPAGAAGAVLNVTVDGSAPGEGYLTVYPCGTMPTSSNLNYSRGEPMAAQVVTKLSASGTVCVFVSETTHLIVDASAFAPVSNGLAFLNQPARLMETRNAATVDGAHAKIGRQPAGAVYWIPVIGRAGIPASATAVSLNATAVESAPGTYLTVFPCGTTQPNASNVNVGTPGQAVSNSTVAKIGAGGSVCVYTSGASHIVVDVGAYFTD